jgi:murein DD-endopeptidase MepM/ murein hydrolase activator NlpD
VKAAIVALGLLALAPLARPSTNDTALPDAASQGALVIGHTSPENRIAIGGRQARVGADGSFAFGIGRDAAGSVWVEVSRPDGSSQRIGVQVAPRDWPVERIVGVPPATVNPPPDLAARIEREQALVASARERDDDRNDYEQAFEWPVSGRVSGRFGNQRVYVLPDGQEAPKAPHSGMDIAAPAGTRVVAPAAGTVTFAAPDLYLTGGTLLLDHGHGISSNFLHLSRIDVRVGQHVARGQVIGEVGATGRATGPHLHWGMNWFDVRIDPQLVVRDPAAP